MYNDIVERAAFEPFSDLSGVLSGLPIRVFPVGTFYRGERKLTVTKDRLQQFAANVKAGLPRFAIPINIEHKDEMGSYGTVEDLEYIEQGIQGPGLYATKYQLTDEGRKLLEQEKFIGLSGEAIWTLFDGAKYQDPQTGREHDNVLVGLALTNKPFFGKQVNLYSATADTYRSFTADERKTMAKSGAAMPGGRYPIANAGDLQNAIHAIGRGKGSHAAIKAHIKKRAAALGLSKSLPENWDDPSDGDADDMSAMEKCSACGKMNPVDAYKCSNCGSPMDNDGDADDQHAARVAKENMTMTEAEKAAADKLAAEKVAAEKLAAEKEKAETFTLNAEQFAAFKAQAADNAKLRDMVNVMQRGRRVDQLTTHVKETFSAVPVKAEDLAEKLADLEAANPDLFKYFDGLLGAYESLAASGNLFSQIGSGLPGTAGPDTLDAAIEKVLTDKFNGDRTKYPDAMLIAGRENPRLVARYEDSYSVRPSKTQTRA